MHSGYIHIIYWYDSHSFPIEPSNSPLRRLAGDIEDGGKANESSWDMLGLGSCHSRWFCKCPWTKEWYSEWSIRFYQSIMLNFISLLYLFLIFRIVCSVCWKGIAYASALPCVISTPQIGCSAAVTLGPWDPGIRSEAVWTTLSPTFRWARRPSVKSSFKSWNPDPLRKSRWMSAQDWWFFKVCKQCGSSTSKQKHIWFFTGPHQSARVLEP